MRDTERKGREGIEGGGRAKKRASVKEMSDFHFYLELPLKYGLEGQGETGATELEGSGGIYRQGRRIIGGYIEKMDRLKVSYRRA